jgi:glycosyltransferase involved in cell wall biosynthesis
MIENIIAACRELGTLRVNFRSFGSEVTDIQLSIVMPVSDMAGKLGNLRQTIKAALVHEIRIVLVHDIRDVATGTELREILNGLSPEKFTLIEGEFGTPGLARNSGLDICESEWVAFWDSDDLPDVGAFISMVKSLVASNAEVAIGGIATKFFDNEDGINYFPAFEINDEKSIFKIAQMPAFTRMVFKRSIIDNSPFPTLSMGEDLVFLARCNFLNRRILIFNKCVYVYILGFPGQLTENKTKLREIQKAWRYLEYEYNKAQGVMRKYIYFQLIRNFFVTVINTHKADISATRILISQIVLHPLLSFKVLFYIFLNRRILVRSSAH